MPKWLCLCQVRDWVDAITREWNFRSIIPAHFAAPVFAGKEDLR